ncbi:hypothetical protein KPC_3520 [Acinetobacter stercoris]|uniref:Uncharacterized protein n=1 Tax=Acinetobacter stercoris TaxID=2126983 RepID=A0A2U3N3V5_9GAMM|nr:hypothetical protein KPC_3520 [Acinetobacter stercoris]
MVGKYQLDEIDVILVQDNGGVACPAELYFIKLIKGRNPVVSPRFGSCSDLVDIFVKTDRIIVKMPMFAGIAEDPVRLKKIGNKKMIYEYDGNVLKENGKVLKSNNE